MYLHDQLVRFPNQSYKNLIFVTSIRHLDLLDAIIEAVREHWKRNNAVFEGSQETDYIMAVQDVPDDVCAAHGFQLVKDRDFHVIEAKREPRYNKLRTH